MNLLLGVGVGIRVEIKYREKEAELLIGSTSGTLLKDGSGVIDIVDEKDGDGVGENEIVGVLVKNGGMEE